MSSLQLAGPYFTFFVFLIAAFLAVGREFWTARGLDKALPLARVCYAVPLAVFGAEHLTDPQSIVRIIPAWMPAKLFWAYFVGVCLIAAAVSFIFRIRMPLAAAMLALMFVLFVAMMHLPNLIRLPHSRAAWNIVMRDSGFGAGALLLSLASLTRARTVLENRLAIGALGWIAVVSAFYGVESLVRPELVPAIPLEKTMPLWIPLAHFWTPLTGVLLILGAAAMLVKKISRAAAAAIGAWVVLMVLTVYLAIMIAQRDIEGLNYFTDTLVFGGELLLASCAYQAAPKR